MAFGIFYLCNHYLNHYAFLIIWYSYNWYERSCFFYLKFIVIVLICIRIKKIIWLFTKLLLIVSLINLHTPYKRQNNWLTNSIRITDCRKSVTVYTHISFWKQNWSKKEMAHIHILLKENWSKQWYLKIKLHWSCYILPFFSVDVICNGVIMRF